MGDNRDKIARFADRLVKLADDYRDDRASVAEDAKKADIDPTALGRLVSWMRKDRTKRAEQEAIDEQYRFLAGETETPATLPAEGMLSVAARLYRDKLSVRQVAGVLNVSTGKAFKLKALAALFTVHADVNTSVNTSAHDADGVITDASAKPDAETIAWAEKVAAELPREPQSTRPLKDFIAERRAASKITDTSPKAPDASSTVTARAPVSTTGDAQGEGDGRSRTDIHGNRPGSGCGGRTDDGDGVAIGVAGREPPAPAEHAGPDRDEAGQLRAAADATAGRVGEHAAGATSGHAGLPAQHGRDDRPGTEANGRTLHATAGPPVGDQGGVEQASTSPPTESLGAVARPSSAERVAPTESNDWDSIVEFGREFQAAILVRQRASAPSKEK